MGPGTGTYGRTGGEAESRDKSEVQKPTRTEVGTDRIPIRSVIRLNIRKKGPGSNRPTPTRKRNERARPSAVTKESRTKRNPIGRDRSGRGWSRHDSRPSCVNYNARWEPVSAKRPSRLGKDDSVRDREREKPSTPIGEASAVTDQRKSEGTAGGGEELEEDAESDIGLDIRHDGPTSQGGKPESEGATAIKDEEIKHARGRATTRDRR
jgi:hypothetical protein